MSSRAEYEEQKKIWYKKLKDSGFNDIETADGQFKGGSTNWKFNSDHATTFSQKAKEEYYYLANQFLNSYDFENELHKIMWDYHAKGISNRKMVEVLKSVEIGKFYKTTKKTRYLERDAIRKVINFYKEIMKSKYVK